ncbi:pyridoxal-phosphate-dependent aminotransferase family protein [Rhabdothermincola sediminis]|uniref:pyridoxal-phosphate-dependent aminotransferase family protein n=1 Tax=Rhabdothermincola sediminis TaxID=2751370 RepID=UPI001AA0324B|nr:alanine--glyoxylate aminotransferase family protein [Rhabdothermincola sediminis]
MARSDRILMGPGPCNPYPEVAEAFARPMLGHLDPEFLELLDETGARLRQVFRTVNPLTFPISATGSAGMEAAFVNVVEPGDVVVVGVNGVFGERMCDVAARCGAEVVRVEAPWGRPLDPQALLDAHPSPKVIALVHAETSTGVRNDVACVGAAKGDALLVVDCVTSLGGIPVEIDGWQVDIAYSGTQKCLGAPPGLAPFTAAPRAVEQLLARPRSWYLDLNMIARYVSGEGARAYHHTAPISMVFALHAALGALLDEGLDAAWARHRSCGQALQEGLEALGLELFAQEGHRLPQLTAVWVPLDRLPAGIDEPAARRLLLERYGIEIGGGLGPFAGKVWRIGCMGHTASMRNVTLLLGALEELLGR